MQGSILGRKILTTENFKVNKEASDRNFNTYRTFRSTTSLSRASFCCLQLVSEDRSFACAVSAAIRLSREVACEVARSFLRASIVLIESA